MAIKWGSYSLAGRTPHRNGMRLGIDVSWSKVTSSSTKATATVKYYYTDYYTVRGNHQTLNMSGSVSGSKAFTNNGGSSTAAGRTAHGIVTKTYTYTYGSTQYGSSPSTRTFAANATGFYLPGVKPTVSVKSAVPTRPYSKPAAPSSVKLTRNSAGGTTVKWKNNSTSKAPYAQIEIQRLTWDGVSSWGSWEHAAWAPANSTSLWVKGQSGNSVYNYRVRAQGRGGTGYSGFAQDSSGIATTPAAPSNLVVKRTNGGAALQVTWTNNAFLAHPANVVQIQRSDGEGGGWSTVATLTNGNSAKSWIDTNPLPGNNQYRIRYQSQYGVGPKLWSGYGTSKVISALVPPLSPVDIVPDGSTFDARDPITLGWTHRDGGDGQDQTRAQYEIGGPSGSNPKPNLAQNASFTSLAPQLGADELQDIMGGGSAQIDIDDHWSSDGTTSLKVSGGSGTATSAYIIGGYGASAPALSLAEWGGKTLTVGVTLHMESTQTDTEPPGGNPTKRARSIMVSTQVHGGARDWTYAYSDQAPNTPGTHRISVTFTLPEAGSVAEDEWFIRLINGSQTVPVWWDSLVIQEGSTGGSWVPPRTITIDGDSNTYTLPPDSLANGYTYTGRARTMGDSSQGYGPWSSTTTFDTSTTPTVSITSPTADEHIQIGYATTEWDYQQAEGKPQARWSATLIDSNGETLETLGGYDNTSTVTFATHLEDQEHYTIKVKVTSSTGLSATDSVTFVADFPPPAAVTVESEWYPCSGAMALQLEAQAPLSGEDEAVSAILQRRVTSGDTDYSEWVTLADEVDLPATILDMTPPLRGETTYRVQSVSEVPAYRTLPDIVVVTPTGEQFGGENGDGTTADDSTWNPRMYEADPYEWVMLNWGDSFATVLRFNSEPSISEDDSGTRSSEPLLGHRRPGLLVGVPTGYSISVGGEVEYAAYGCPGDDDGCRFGSLPEEWRAAGKRSDVVCYRDYTGRRVFGFIDGDISVGETKRPGIATVSFKVTEVGYTERYDPVTGSEGEDD